jgi:hypothetical protein
MLDRCLQRNTGLGCVMWSMQPISILYSCRTWFWSNEFDVGKTGELMFTIPQSSPFLYTFIGGMNWTIPSHGWLVMFYPTWLFQSCGLDRSLKETLRTLRVLRKRIRQPAGAPKAPWRPAPMERHLHIYTILHHPNRKRNQYLEKFSKTIGEKNEKLMKPMAGIGAVECGDMHSFTASI